MIYMYLLYIIYSLEQLYRAYIPKSSVKWFNNLMNQEGSFDLWLSTRVNSHNTKLNQSSTISYDYFADFRVKDSKIMLVYRNQFENREIYLKLLNDNIIANR